MFLALEREVPIGSSIRLCTWLRSVVCAYAVVATYYNLKVLIE
jgi:hypothetical protein